MPWRRHLLTVLAVTGLCLVPAAAQDGLDVQFEMPATATVGEQVRVDASETEVPESVLAEVSDSTVQYTWQIRGPAYLPAKRGQSATYTFPEPGTYTVRLQVVVISATDVAIGDKYGMATREIRIKSVPNVSEDGEDGGNGAATEQADEPETVDPAEYRADRQSFYDGYADRGQTGDGGAYEGASVGPVEQESTNGLVALAFLVLGPVLLLGIGLLGTFLVARFAWRLVTGGGE